MGENSRSGLKLKNDEQVSNRRENGINRGWSRCSQWGNAGLDSVVDITNIFVW